LDENPQFQFNSIDEILPEKCRPFLHNRYFKTFPPTDKMDGFFVARLIKSSGHNLAGKRMDDA
jgi:16S rRNA C967 or C1407 C5-methylase (RsmB/RsmF family)